MKSREVTGLRKDELGGRIMKEYVTLRQIMYSYLRDDGLVDKKRCLKNKLKRLKSGEKNKEK